MAGASQVDRSAWPHGEGALIPIELRSQELGGDTSGYKIEDSFQADYDFNVRKATIRLKEGSVSITGGINVKVFDDSSSVQTIIAERAITAADDTGLPRALTVADAGPILTGGIVTMSVDSNSSDTLENLVITLWVEPIYK